MLIPNLPAEAVVIAVVVSARGVFRTLQAGPLLKRGHALRWMASGAAMVLALGCLVRLGIVLAWAAAVILVLVWATPLLSLALFRSQRLLLRTRVALGQGDLAKADALLAEAGVAVNQSSPVDLEWNRVQLSELEGRIRMAEGRIPEAAPPLRESVLRAIELGVPCYVRESATLLMECYRVLGQWEEARDLARQTGISLDSPARHVSDNGASVPAAPADTISPRSP